MLAGARPGDYGAPLQKIWRNFAYKRITKLNNVHIFSQRLVFGFFTNKIV